MKPLALIVSLAAMLAGLAAPEKAFSIAFTFNPPDSTELWGAITTERVRYTDGTQSPIDSTVQTTYHLFRRTATGFEMISQPLSIITTREGQRIKNPIFSVLADTEIHTTLDSTGFAQKVEGYEDILTKIEQVFPEIIETAKRSLDPKLTAEEDRARWNSRIPILSGRQLRLGDIAYSTIATPLPNDSTLSVYVVCSVTDTSTVDGKLQAGVEYHADSDFSRLAESLKRSPEELAVDMQAPKSALSARGDGAGDQTRMTVRLLMEVETMLVLRQNTREETTIHGVGSDGARHEIRQVKTEAGTYNRGKGAKPTR